jgi:hypothetical protein
MRTSAPGSRERISLPVGIGVRDHTGTLALSYSSNCRPGARISLRSMRLRRRRLALQHHVDAGRRSPVLADFVAKVGFEVVLTASADF